MTVPEVTLADPVPAELLQVPPGVILLKTSVFAPAQTVADGPPAAIKLLVILLIVTVVVAEPQLVV